MIYVSDLQKETLLLVDKMIQENKTFTDIQDYLYNNDYIFSQEIKNGYMSKTRFRIEKITRKHEGKQTFLHYDYTFVDLIKRKNGLASWETIRLF